MKNLDFLTAKYGQLIIEDASNKDKAADAATKSLAILHEQGIYAMFLWLHEDKEGRGDVGKMLSRMLTDDEYGIIKPEDGEHKHVRFFSSGGSSQIKASLEAVRDYLTKDLTQMLFVKDLIAQTLVYARHRAKAEPKSKNGSGE